MTNNRFLSLELRKNASIPTAGLFLCERSHRIISWKGFISMFENNKKIPKLFPGVKYLLLCY